MDGLQIFGGDVRHHGINEDGSSEVSEDGRHVGESVSNAMYQSAANSLNDWRLITIPGLRPPAEFWGHRLFFACACMCVYARVCACV